MDKGIEDHCISMAALGRCFELGDFYNYRNDQIIKDYSEGKLTTSFVNLKYAQETGKSF